VRPEQPYDAGLIDYLLIVGTAVVLAIPLILRVYRRRFDVFEPLTLASFALLLLFVARPLYDFLAGYQWLGYDNPLDWRGALLITFIGVVAFEIGYHMPVSRRLAARLPRPPQDSDGQASLVLAAALTVAAAGAVLTVGYLKGGLGLLFANRAEATRFVPPFVAEAFLVALPATLLFLAAAVRRRRRTVALLALIPAGVILLMAIPAGNRRYLLPLLLALVTFAYLVRGRRPPLVPIAVSVVLVLLLVINPLRDARTGDISYPEATLESVRNPHTALESLLRAGDTSMIETMALEMPVLGDEVPYRYGLELVGDTILAPIPRQVWPDKPQKTSTLLIDHFYGTAEGGGCIVHCPSFAFFGEAAADFGLVSVALISALFGLLLATGYQYLLQHQGALLAQVAFASGLWLAFQPWEAGMSMITHSFILTVLPVAAVGLLARRRDRAIRVSRRAVGSAT